jgi:hypothetical protein
MGESGDRYLSAIRRNLAETNNAILKRRALTGLYSIDSAHGLDFFRIAAHALYNDLVSHALRVFDRNGQSASFWYVVRTDEAIAKRAARRHGVSLDEIERLSEQFKHIRDKTHFHIDRDAVMDPSKVWSTAGLTGDELGYVLESAWKVLAGIWHELRGESFEIPEYDGSDVGKIIRAYSKAHPDAHIVV